MKTLPWHNSALTICSHWLRRWFSTHWEELHHHLQLNLTWEPEINRSESWKVHRNLFEIYIWMECQCFTEDISKCIFLNENCCKFTEVCSMEFNHNNWLASVLVMAWPGTGHKPLSEPMVVSLLMHICIIGPQCASPAANIENKYKWYVLKCMGGIIVVQLLPSCEKIELFKQMQFLGRFIFSSGFYRNSLIASKWQWISSGNGLVFKKWEGNYVN